MAAQKTPVFVPILLAALLLMCVLSIIGLAMAGREVPSSLMTTSTTLVTALLALYVTPPHWQGQQGLVLAQESVAGRLGPRADG